MKRFALAAIALWIIGGLISLLVSIATLALSVWVVVWVLQSMGVM